MDDRPRSMTSQRAAHWHPVRRARCATIAVALAILAVVIPSSAAVIGEPTEPVMVTRRQVVLRAGDAQLAFDKQAVVGFTTVERIATDIATPVSPTLTALRVTRPAETIDYVLCVTDEGRLVVGEQWRQFDYGERRYTFTHGQISRAYSPIADAGPWTWLVTIPFSRDHDATFELRADTRWPVETVTISSVDSR